jgi:hypothetical protein
VTRRCWRCHPWKPRQCSPSLSTFFLSDHMTGTSPAATQCCHLIAEIGSREAVTGRYSHCHGACAVVQSFPGVYGHALSSARARAGGSHRCRPTGSAAVPSHEASRLRQRVRRESVVAPVPQRAALCRVNARRTCWVALHPGDACAAWRCWAPAVTIPAGTMARVTGTGSGLRSLCALRWNACCEC